MFILKYQFYFFNNIVSMVSTIERFVEEYKDSLRDGMPGVEAKAMFNSYIDDPKLKVTSVEKLMEKLKSENYNVKTGKFKGKCGFRIVFGDRDRNRNRKTPSNDSIEPPKGVDSNPKGEEAAAADDKITIDISDGENDQEPKPKKKSKGPKHGIDYDSAFKAMRNATSQKMIR